MTESERAPKLTEFEATRDNRGASVNVFVGELNPDTDDPRAYDLHVSVERNGITHAPLLKVISSQPPLPGYEPGAEYKKVTLNTKIIRVAGKIGLNAPEDSGLSGMHFVVHEITEL